jgi:hypothetical protein
MTGQADTGPLRAGPAAEGLHGAALGAGRARRRLWLSPRDDQRLRATISAELAAATTRLQQASSGGE